jgi:DNA-binding response OmpR family regulator
MAKTVLVVDDDVLILKILNLIFSTNGFKVLEAANGQEALEVLDSRKKNIDLIITDFNMPAINGLELANAVRIHKKHNKTPLILITSDTRITRSSEHYNVFNEIIHKPFPSELILNKADVLISK